LTNAIQDSGCAALTRAIRVLPRLRRVDLGYNNLSENCATLLERALATVSTSSEAEKLLPLDVIAAGNFGDKDGTKLLFAVAPNLARSKLSFQYEPTMSPRLFPAPDHYVQDPSKQRAILREQRRSRGPRITPLLDDLEDGPLERPPEDSLGEVTLHLRTSGTWVLCSRNASQARVHRPEHCAARHCAARPAQATIRRTRSGKSLPCLKS